MKKIIFLFVLLCASFLTYAQTQVATLQHNDSIIGVFYGQNAFISAHDAAVDGDVITLSSGTFQSCEINKSIIIHGAGCVYDSRTQMTPTIISGDLFIRKDNISFEGINSTGIVKCTNRHNIVFVKCNINSIMFPDGYQVVSNRNWQFINCIIKQFASYAYHSGGLGASSQGCFLGMSVINSVIRFTVYNHLDIYNATTINNSLILFDTGLTVNNIMAYNSIIATVSGHTVSNCTFNNCIGIKTGETSLFDGQIANNVMEMDGYDNVFETFDGTVTYDNAYQLKEEIATSFLGNDGTEVGIYGGMMPYNPRPSYMILKHCNVAPRSTVDGKLSVDIEIIAEDD